MHIDTATNPFHIVIKNRPQIKRITFTFTKLLIFFKVWAVLGSSKVWENGWNIIPIFASNKWERSFSVESSAENTLKSRKVNECSLYVGQSHWIVPIYCFKVDECESIILQ